jgi:uncharacterized protein (UPF0548 family)
VKVIRMRLVPARRFDVRAAVDALRGRRLNYEVAEVRAPQWRFDEHRHELGVEAPGEPVPGGVWERACEVVAEYGFTPPELLHAHYRRDRPLLGRDLLLVGRFSLLRFAMGVRITDVEEIGDAGHRSWGWGYETLQGHIERGKVFYAVVKDLATGVVALEVSSHNQVNPRAHPVVRLGWRLFGRRTQQRFYRRVGERLRLLANAAPRGLPGGEVVVVPFDAAQQNDPPWTVTVVDGAND